VGTQALENIMEFWLAMDVQDSSKDQLEESLFTGKNFSFCCIRIKFYTYNLIKQVFKGFGYLKHVFFVLHAQSL
jgi:hypothetical protein